MCPVASVALLVALCPCLVSSAAIAGSLNFACLFASPAPNTSLIASSLFPLTQLHVVFAIATATACIVNCLCVAHAHVMNFITP